LGYEQIKAAILRNELTVNKRFLPASNTIFSIIFYHKEITEPVIRAVVDEDVILCDPLIEHQGDIIKAVRSSIRQDVFTWDIRNHIYTLDMQRSYFKTRNRNRNIYYGAKELSEQIINDGKYERLKQISITFIYEKNTTPHTQPLAKIQLTDIKTQEVYSDLLTIYEVNLNRIAESNEQNLPQVLRTLTQFLSIKTHEDLCDFVNTQNTPFAERLVMRYMDAIIDDALLIEIEGSEKFMIKLTEELLREEREEGKFEGKIEGLINAAANMVMELHLTVTQAMQIVKLPEQETSRIIEELERANVSYAL